MATKTTSSPTKVVTGKVRLSYAHIWEAHSSFEGQDPKYSAVLLIPKKDRETYNKIKAAQQAALEAGKNSKFGGKIPKGWKDTIHDGDDEQSLEDHPEYEGHWYMSVSSKTKPGIVDRDLNPIMDQSEVYSGCYVRVSINAFAYSVSGSKGVSFGLNHIQKLADGKPFAGFSRAEDDFSDDLDDDDDDDYDDDEDSVI